jgi:uncharacterized protein
MRKILIWLLALILTSTLFTAWTFGRLERLAGWAWMLIPILLVVTFLPTTMLSHRRRARWLSALNVLSGISVGLLTYFVLAALVCWILLGISHLAGVSVDPRSLASWSYGAAALVGLFALFSGYWLRVTRITARLPNLPRFWKGRTVALVSDIHLGNFRGAAFSRRVVSKLMDLDAECVLVGGDMFDGVRTGIEQAVRPWSDLSARSGVYFVGGNHDDYGGRKAYFAALSRVGMRILDNEKVEIHGLQLVGVHDREIHKAGNYRAVLDKVGLDKARASILLAHRPENLAVPEEAGISLQLSGHTHGGQFWPWTHVARRVHGKFARGLNKFGRMLVFTSTGSGTWGPPLRLGTRSEVVLIRLEAA